MKTRAAVVRELNRLEIETVDLAVPQANELLIRMKAAGVCHSDLHALRGELRPRPPVVLGHEGAGLVEAVGSSVTAFKPGDRVLVNWLLACGACPICWSGRPYLCERLGLLTLYRAGKLPIDRLVTRRYQLAELPQAFADMEAGQATRGVIMFD